MPPSLWADMGRESGPSVSSNSLPSSYLESEAFDFENVDTDCHLVCSEGQTLHLLDSNH